MPILLKTAGLLVLSNLFLTFAWYAHLRTMPSRVSYVAALASWGIALFEYLLQVLANRIGYAALTLGQLKIVQEVITLCVFVPFAVLYMKQPIKLDHLWPAVCLLGAVCCVFRGLRARGASNRSACSSRAANRHPALQLVLSARPPARPSAGTWAAHSSRTS